MSLLKPPRPFALTRTSLHFSLNIREYARTQVLAEDGTTLPLETIQFSDGKLTANMAGVRATVTSRCWH